jgi:hypothetical protein
MKLSEQQIEAIRRRIEERARTEAVLWVLEGADLDYGRVSRMEWIATGSIVLDAEAIDALLCDGAMALDVRAHVDDQVRRLTEAWFDTPRGEEWLAQKVEESLAEELEQEAERLAEVKADALAMRFER